MPYASYALMTDADALAIKAYLSSLAPVRAPTPPTTFGWPFNQRRLMGLWSWMFNPAAAFRPDPDRSPQWTRGAYLAEARSAEHTSELQSLMRLSYAVFCLKKTNTRPYTTNAHSR